MSYIVSKLNPASDSHAYMCDIFLVIVNIAQVPDNTTTRYAERSALGKS